MTMTPDAMLSFKRQYVADSLMRAAPLEVTVTNPGGSSGGLTNTELRASPVPISGTVTANVGTVAVTGPLTDAQLRNSAISVTFTNSSLGVTGPLTDAQLRAAALPISAAALPLPSGAATETTLGSVNTKTPALGQAAMASSSPVVIASNQSAVPVSGTVTANAGSGTMAVRDLKDAGRSSLAMTAEFTFAQTAETLLTMTFSADGAATSTFSSRVVTSGKTMRFQQVMIELESLGSGTAPQRAYLRLRRNNSGATTASSPLQSVWSCVNSTAVVKSGNQVAFDIPDGLEIVGDGTKTFGFTLETPDWVATTATGRAKITVIGFEY
jgi:hypothetical protein